MWRGRVCSLASAGTLAAAAGCRSIRTSLRTRATRRLGGACCSAWKTPAPTPPLTTAAAVTAAAAATTVCSPAPCLAPAATRPRAPRQHPLRPGADCRARLGREAAPDPRRKATTTHDDIKGGNNDDKTTNDSRPAHPGPALRRRAAGASIGSVGVAHKLIPIGSARQQICKSLLGRSMMVKRLPTRC